MEINNINIVKFGAMCQSKLINHTGIFIELEMPNKFINPIELEEVRELTSISIKLKFEANNRDEMYKNISNLITLTKRCTIKFRNISNNFQCYYVNHDVEETGIDEWLFLNLEMQGYEYSDMKTINFDKQTSTTIKNDGNLVTPAIVEITPIADIIDISVEGLSDDPILIRNLKANKTVIIDGELQKVTVDGINKFADTDMWEFPRLTPSTNSIKVSRNNCNITIKYKPRWI